MRIFTLLYKRQHSVSPQVPVSLLWNDVMTGTSDVMFIHPGFHDHVIRRCGYGCVVGESHLQAGVVHLVWRFYSCAAVLQAEV